MTRLKLWRLQAQLTQAEAAQRCGVSIGLYRELEAGRARPSDRVAALLEKAVGESAVRLLKPTRVPVGV